MRSYKGVFKCLIMKYACAHLYGVLQGSYQVFNNKINMCRNVSGSPVLQGELTANYDMLTNLGYQNPYLQNDGTELDMIM